MLKKLGDFFNKHLFNLVLLFLIILNVLPFLAPIFASWGWYWPARVIYFVYSFFCHQFHYRSLHIYDHQCAWCARDTFIWGSILVIGLIAKFFSIKPIKWYWVIPFTIPIALDGIIQTVATVVGFGGADPWYMSTNLLRMLTGSLFGIGLGLWLMPNLKAIAAESLTGIKQNQQLKNWPAWLITVVVLTAMIIFYLLLVQIWNLTSPNYQPANFLDWAVKNPATIDGWLERGKNTI